MIFQELRGLFLHRNLFGNLYAWDKKAWPSYTRCGVDTRVSWFGDWKLAMYCDFLEYMCLWADRRGLLKRPRWDIVHLDRNHGGVETAWWAALTRRNPLYSWRPIRMQGIGITNECIQWLQEWRVMAYTKMYEFNLIPVYGLNNVFDTGPDPGLDSKYFYSFILSYLNSPISSQYYHSTMSKVHFPMTNK